MYSVTDYKGTDASVVIPRKHFGWPVTSIGGFAFSAPVVIGSGINKAGAITASAFAGCAALQQQDAFYYKGSPEDWEKVGYKGLYPTAVFYNEAEPSDEEHYYWHYQDNNETKEILIWGNSSR